MTMAYIQIAFFVICFFCRARTFVRRVNRVSSPVTTLKYTWLLKVNNSPRDDDVTFVNESTLRDMWVNAGYSIDSFSEANALLKFFDDDEISDDFGEIISYNLTEDISVPSSIDSSNSIFSSIHERTESLSSADAATTAKTSFSSRSVGIDLGTTFSAVSVIECGQPRIVAVDGGRVVPSIVGYRDDGSIVVGEHARRQKLVNPKNTFASVKRVIGKTLKDVKTAGENLSLLRVDARTASDSASCHLKCPQLDRRLLPEEVSAEVLRKLLGAASEYLGGEQIKNAVITIPAYFLPSQCEATERAGKLAGLEKVKLLREPEAAALAYGLTKRKQQIVLVFDLGGGTLDVSVLEVGDGFVEVIATSGDAHLGGDDFDEIIANWMLDQLASAHGAAVVNAIRGDPVAMSRVYETAQNTKIQLSSAAKTDIELPLLHKEISLSTSLTRSKFESMSKGLLTRMLKPLREVAIMAGVNLPGESGQLGFTSNFFDPDTNNASDDSDTNGRDDVDDSTDGLADIQFAQQQGRKDARSKKKVQGRAGKELRRLQKQLGDSKLAAFPSGQTLDDVVLVGGSTRIPAVRRLVDVVTGVATKRTVNPDEAVSLGAAIMAGILDGVVEDMQVMSAWQAAMYRAFYEEKLRDKDKKEKQQDVQVSIKDSEKSAKTTKSSVQIQSEDISGRKEKQGDFGEAKAKNMSKVHRSESRAADVIASPLKRESDKVVAPKTAAQPQERAKVTKRSTVSSIFRSKLSALKSQSNGARRP